MASETDPNQGIKRGLQFLGEAMMPGASNLINGDLKNAGIYFVAAFAAKAVFGVPGLLFVSANSFSKARTGRSLIEHLGSSINAGDDGKSSKK